MYIRTYDLFLWIDLNSLKAAEPQQGDSLSLTSKFLGVPGTCLIDLGGMIEVWVVFLTWECNTLTTMLFLLYTYKSTH